MAYKLSATLKAHSSDVRALTSPSNDLVLSASRDASAISWARGESGANFTPAQVFHPGTRYINSITYLPATDANPQGYVVTGGQDALINVFALGSGSSDPEYTLVGHQENVCTLHSTSSGTIVSGSWDKTAKVWKAFNLAHELVGHAQAVWAVLAIDDETYLTGSADKTIKSWQVNKVTRTYTGHNDAVRSLCLIPDIGFASCSNDSEIRVWTAEGDIVHILSGHTSFVYSIAVLPNGDLVSGGEDRSVRVWKDGSCHQTIVHPAISVWAVSTMANGDIVTGCSDGLVRIFSVDSNRWASVDELKSYEDTVAAQLLPSQQVGDVKKSDLPGPEVLLQPGKKDGQVLMVRSGDTVEAHQWDGAAFKWQKVGEVVDAVGSGRKQLYEGKEYDYVFDVDIQDGVPPLKLPYNANENPFQAAKRFLEKNDLPMSYIDEVVQFIEKNTSGSTIGATREEYMDPFTGASRYRSSGESQPQGGTFVDPFTGASRYQPAAQSAPPSGGVPSSDPFTGGSRYTPQAEEPTRGLLPIGTCLGFKQANTSAMKNKLLSLNSELNADQRLALSAAELTLVDETFTALSVALATKAPVGVGLAGRHLDNISSVLQRWPSEKLFPLIDLGRILAAYAPSAFTASPNPSKYFDILFQVSGWNSEWTSPLSKPLETNLLLVSRTLANAVYDTTKPGELAWLNEALLQISNRSWNALGKNHKVALSTVVFNVSTVLLKGPLVAPLPQNYWTALRRALRESDDPEAFYRALVAVGNTLYSAKKYGIAGWKLDEEELQVTKEKVQKMGESRMTDMMKEIEKFV